MTSLAQKMPPNIIGRFAQGGLSWSVVKQGTKPVQLSGNQRLGLSSQISESSQKIYLGAREKVETLTIHEIDRVALLGEISTTEGVMPVGTVGTVVYRYNNGEAYEVEFTKPFHLIATLKSNEISKSRD